MSDKRRRRGGGSGALVGREPRPAKTSSERPSFRDPAVLASFENYRRELDCRHDRHECLVKLSRDVTIESKRIIFLLHRISVKSTPEERETVLTEAQQRLEAVRDDKLKHIAEEMKDEDHSLYSRAFSPGLQEYIEALSFYHFRCVNEIISHPFSLQFSTAESGPPCPLSSQDYVLGLADLSGEIMRMAVNSAAAGDRNEPGRMLTVLRGMAAGFHSLQGASLGRDLGRKVQVLEQSLAKIERLCYTLHVRGEEALTGHLLVAAVEAPDDATLE